MTDPDREERIRISALDIEIDEVYRRLHPNRAETLQDAVGQMGYKMLRQTLHLLDAVLMQVEVSPDDYSDIMQRMIFGMMPNPAYFVQRQVSLDLQKVMEELVQTRPARVRVQDEQ